jgi:hypothetical protein
MRRAWPPRESMSRSSTKRRTSFGKRICPEACPHPVFGMTEYSLRRLTNNEASLRLFASIVIAERSCGAGMRRPGR